MVRISERRSKAPRNVRKTFANCSLFGAGLRWDVQRFRESVKRILKVVQGFRYFVQTFRWPVQTIR